MEKLELWHLYAISLICISLETYANDDCSLFVNLLNDVITRMLKGKADRHTIYIYIW